MKQIKKAWGVVVSFTDSLMQARAAAVLARSGHYKQAKELYK
jgi:hypothetical protein